MWTATYILSIVLVNWLFVVVPGVPTPFGELYLATLVVGAVFVLRDYAQREVGHFVLLATLAAGAITWFMTSPELAVASITAFAISEMADWAVFTFTGRPLQKRILISSMISVPLDSLAFLYLSGFLTPVSFSTETVSKAIGVVIVWMLLKMREDRRLAGA
ncbi:MAG TPA: VUT family protein [Aestuariivirga sp.]|nr:VUT family protein [Aestuariivirga sp.]